MKRCIKYYDILNEIELEYSDETLIQSIHSVSIGLDKVTHINMLFVEEDKNVGCVYLVISNGPYVNLNNQAVLRLHEIDLTEESFRDCVKECQREKEIIQKHFRRTKVSSNFR